MKKFLFVALLFATIVLKAQTATPLDTMYIYTTKHDTTTTWRIIKSSVPTKVGVFAGGVMYEMIDEGVGSVASTANAWNIISYIKSKSGCILTTSQMVQILLFAGEEIPQWLVKTTRI